MAKDFRQYSTYPRGMRNNNPGNLINNGDPWKGLVGTDSANFMIFQNMAWGIRALALDLINDIRKGKNTISKLITEFAPPQENDTVSYINSVCQSTGFSANQILYDDRGTLHKLIRAIMRVEVTPSYASMLTDADIAEGLDLTGKAPVSESVLIGSAFVSAALLSIAIYGLVTMEKMPTRSRG